jgi:hypothetical protein
MKDTVEFACVPFHLLRTGVAVKHMLHADGSGFLDCHRFTKTI